MVSDIVREYFPKANDWEVNFIIWEKTGYPEFFSGDPETCLRQQLRQYAIADKIGADVCYGCGQIRPVSAIKYGVCGICDKKIRGVRRF